MRILFRCNDDAFTAIHRGRMLKLSDLSPRVPAMLMRRSGMFLVSILLLLVGMQLALAVESTAPAPASTNPASVNGDLTWRGDIVSARAFMNAIASGYEKAGYGHITVTPFSTLSGLDAVVDGSVDLAGIARHKHPRRTEEQSINFIPIALDAVVLLVHARNPVDNVSLAQIRDIYLGRITNWKALGGEDKPINLYSIASPLDGVEYSLRELVFGRGTQSVAAPRAYLNTAMLEQAIAIDPAGMGVSTLSVTWDNKTVKRLRVEGIAASSASIADGSYPLYNTLYLADSGNSPHQDRIDRLLGYLSQPTAKGILRQHQLVPYSDVDNVIARNDTRMAFIDAHLNDATAIEETPTAVASTTPPTPVSAPRATLESQVRIAPTSASADAARENLARAEAAKRAKEETARKEAEAARQRDGKTQPASTVAPNTSTTGAATSAGSRPAQIAGSANKSGADR